MKPDAPVGIVGLGLMGIALSARLIDARIPLIGFDIDPARCGMFKDGHAFLAAARQSTAYSRVMDSKGEKMLTGDFRPQSHISQTLKDAELIIEAIRQQPAWSRVLR